MCVAFTGGPRIHVLDTQVCEGATQAQGPDGRPHATHTIIGNYMTEPPPWAAAARRSEEAAFGIAKQGLMLYQHLYPGADEPPRSDAVMVATRHAMDAAHRGPAFDPSMLVELLGDPTSKVATRAADTITCLLGRHGGIAAHNPRPADAAALVAAGGVPALIGVLRHPDASLIAKDRAAVALGRLAAS